MSIQQLLELVISRNASDLHLVVGFMPHVRIHGELIPIPGSSVISPTDVEGLVFPILTPLQKEVFLREFELDFGFEFENKARFRINLYRQRGTIAAAMRLIPNQIRNMSETGLPETVAHLTDLRQGLVLVTGPTGHGKSTTLASMINQINHTRSAHILTVEDPIEFIYPPGKSVITQRELNADTKSFGAALKYSLREDPDVLLVGEMRDLETISATVTLAETGHLVFATLHTNSASQTIDRVIDVFPENQQAQIRTQLAGVLEAIISVRLVPTIAPGRALAAEILYGIPALRSIIRDGKTHLIDNLIQTSGEFGMISMETSLAALVKQGRVSADVAKSFAVRPQVFMKLLGGNS
jgi:twitching motility protein PilT